MHIHISQNLKEWLIDIAVSVVLAGIILIFFMPTIVQQHSMENTLKPNDYLFVSRQAYRLFGKPQRGDIIVFQSDLPLNESKNKLLIKRIIALPGDTIAIKDGFVILNGEAITEEYTKDGYTKGDMEEVTVPEGHIFTMGDNRQNSTDSRQASVGMVDIKSVKGKAVFRMYPFKKIGGLYK